MTILCSMLCHMLYAGISSLIFHFIFIVTNHIISFTKGVTRGPANRAVMLLLLYVGCVCVPASPRGRPGHVSTHSFLPRNESHSHSLRENSSRIQAAESDAATVLAYVALHVDLF